MLGYDYQDPACAQIAGMPVSGIMTNGIAGLRIVRASGYFARNGHADAFEAVERVASALGVTTDVEIADAKAARAAAYLITMSEGAALHLDRIREHHSEFDPDVRDRLIAGAMIPGAWVARAQKLRRIFRQRMLQVFESVDAIIAPATPCRAPRIGQRTMTIDGVEMPVRPNLGLFSQPISFIGFPVVTVPVWTSGERLPIGVQIITAPWREDIGMCIAHWLESRGIVHAPIASGE